MKFRLLLLILHALAGWVSLRAAFYVRFYFDPPPAGYQIMLLLSLPWAMGFKALAAEVAGLTRSMWRYASFRDLMAVAAAAAAGSALLVGYTYVAEGGRYPNGVLLLDFLFTGFLFTAIRFSGRFWSEVRRRLRDDGRRRPARVLILGAGPRGEMAVRFLEGGAGAPARIVGFLDDAPENRGRSLHGIPVRGRLDELEAQLSARSVDEVVIALPDPSPETVRGVFATASAAGARVSILPEVSALGEGDLHRNPIRELNPGDFLGRAPVELDPAPLEDSLRGCTVLVTGGGGSIGSELCRQLQALPLAKLLVLDFSETALFEVMDELSAQKGSEQKGSARDILTFSPSGDEKSENVKMHGLTPFAFALLVDIRDREALASVFSEHKPDVVFHAAACKHVSMMEAHPLEAARTNVLGTRNVVDCARAAGVERLLHVSTDKAVRPTGVMGASKAWGERIVRAAGYSCVRFGNVLGSSGSVIPLFEKQWRRHGELRVTDGEATRYFMTIEEAVLLILHAESLRERGRIYILDMGEPVNILEVARQMVAFKGRTGDPSRHIRIVGLRPGERLHERLHTEEEQLEDTPVPKVRRVAGNGDRPGAPDLSSLEAALSARDPGAVRSWLLGEGAPSAEDGR